MDILPQELDRLIFEVQPAFLSSEDASRVFVEQTDDIDDDCRVHPGCRSISD